MKGPRLLCTALGALVLVPAATADAGTYKVEMCRLSDGSPAAVTGWSGVHENTCPAGGSFGLNWPSGTAYGVSTSAGMGVPANVAIARADVWRLYEAALSAQTAQPRVWSTWETRGWGGSGGYSGDWGQNAFNPAAPGNALSVSWPSSLTLGMQCLWNGPGDPNRCGGTMKYLIHKLDLIMSDGVAPQITQAPTGAVVGTGWLTGAAATMSVGASDVGAGAYRAFIREGSTTRYALLNPQLATCHDVETGAGTAYEFADMVPCATGGGVYTPSFDLTALGDGVHDNVTIGIEDAAGNEKVALTGRSLRVNAPGGVLSDPGTPCPNGAYDDAGVCQPTAPAPTSDPILSGTAQQSATLTTDPGAWSNIAGASWAYAWQRCDTNGSGCVDIAGATGTTYGLTLTDVGRRVRSKVSVTTNGGTGTAYSVASPIVSPSGGGGGGGGTGGGGGVVPVLGGSVARGGGGLVVAEPPGPALPPATQPPGGGDGRRGNGDAATTNASMTLRIGSSDRREVTVGYGRRVVVDGRLASAKGRPIGGATIDVFSASRAGGATTRRLAPVVSAADGSFRAILPVGPSRTVRFAYRAFADDAEYAESADLELRVKTAARLKAAPRQLRNGAAVMFRGAVPGAGASSRKVVEMQVLQGGRWLTFGTARLRHGRFGYRYRFTRTLRTTSYVFRTVVRGDTGWPYETGASNRVKVTVRP